jgi:hypothetical protein
MRQALVLGTVVLALIVAPSASARSTYDYPSSFERAFMSSCNASSGGMTSMCRCALRWIERRYTYRQIAWIFVHDKARMRKIMVNAAYACVR